MLFEYPALTKPKRPTSLTMGNNPFESHRRVAPLHNTLRQPPARNFGHLRGKENFSEADDAVVLFSGTATGPPSKSHWKPDSTAVKCSMACCPRIFGLFERRHHCRRCGDIFCGEHCSHYIRLDQNSNFNLAGSASRVCDRCHEEYSRLLNRCKRSDRFYKERRHSRIGQQRDSGYDSASDSSSSDSYESLSRLETRDVNVPTPGVQKNLPPPIPRDWSTF